MYNEITEPVPVQILLMGGNYVQLLCYQLNSLTALWKAEDAGIPHNMAWHSERIPLFADEGYVFGAEVHKY